jgi:hypothetical protein
MGEFAAAAAIGTTVASGLLQAHTARRQGQQEQVALEMQARQEEGAAREREVERRRRLVRALSSQIAVRGRQGIDMGSGSAAAIARSDASLADLDRMTGRVNVQRQTAQLRQQGRMARRMGRTRAATSLLDTGRDVALQLDR